MSINAYSLTASFSFTSGTTFTTASVAPTANRLQLLAFATFPSAFGTPVGVTSVVGNGLTWVLVGSVRVDAAGGSGGKLFLYRAMGAAPTSGTIVITLSASSTSCAWALQEFDLVDITGTNGSGAIVQSATNSASGSGSLTTTLNAFASANNATFAAIFPSGIAGSPGAVNVTQGTGYSLLYNNQSAEWTGVGTEWRTDNDITCDCTLSVVADGVGMVAVELNAYFGGGGGTTTLAYRNPYLLPFAVDSIWNTPIGSSATYSAANLATVPNPGGGTQFQGIPWLDLENISLTPTSPSTSINVSTVGWGSGNRCSATGGLLQTVNIPSSFTIQDLDGGQHGNNCAAFLAPDLRTVQQNQPFARCTAGASATSWIAFPNQDLYGQGEGGSHGGSQLSAIGGCIRIGELRPSGALNPYTHGPTHALKLNLHMGRYGYRNTTQSNLFRWPATTADGYATQSTDPGYGTVSGAPNANNSYMVLGALLAIPASTDITTLGLTTDAGKQLAWTLQNYGGYLCDDTGGFEAYMIMAEQGSSGDKRIEFQNDFGFAMQQGYTGSASAWNLDIGRLFHALRCVTNNAVGAKGGGGTPRVPVSLPFSGAWQSEAHTYSASGTSLVITKPSGTVSGDILIASIGTTGNIATITAPAGWNLIQHNTQGATSSTAQQSTYWRLAGGAEGANYTWTLSATGISNGCIWRTNSIDPVNPINTSTANSGTGTTLAGSAVTPTVNNVLLGLFTINKSTGSTQNASTYWTQRNSALGTSALQCVSSHAAQYDKLSSGSITNVSNGVAGDSWTAHLIALNPKTTTVATTVYNSSVVASSVSNAMIKMVVNRKRTMTAVEQSLGKITTRATLKKLVSAVAVSISKGFIFRKIFTKKIATPSISTEFLFRKVALKKVVTPSVSVSTRKATKARIVAAVSGSALKIAKGASRKVFIASTSAARRAAGAARKLIATPSVSTEFMKRTFVRKAVATPVVSTAKDIRGVLVKKLIADASSSHIISFVKTKFVSLSTFNVSATKRKTVISVKKIATPIISTEFLARALTRPMKATPSVSADVVRRSISRKIIASSTSITKFVRSIITKKWAPNISGSRMSKALTAKKSATNNSAGAMGKRMAIMKKSTPSVSTGKITRAIIKTRIWAVSTNLAKMVRAISTTRAALSINTAFTSKMTKTGRVKAAQANAAYMKRAVLLRRTVVSVSTGKMVKRFILTKLAIIQGTASKIKRAIVLSRAATNGSAARVARVLGIHRAAVSTSAGRRISGFTRKLTTTQANAARLVKMVGKNPVAIATNAVRISKRSLVKMMRAISGSTVYCVTLPTMISSTTGAEFIVVAQSVQSFII